MMIEERLPTGLITGSSLSRDFVTLALTLEREKAAEKEKVMLIWMKALNKEEEAIKYNQRGDRGFADLTKGC
jgi:hypothetical protein